MMTAEALLIEFVSVLDAFGSYIDTPFERISSGGVTALFRRVRDLEARCVTRGFTSHDVEREQAREGRA